MKPKRSALLLLLLIAAAFQTSRAYASPVSVRYLEGVIHGFLVLRTADGVAIADGELAQTVRGDRVKNYMSFHFKDGSIREETAIFSQRGVFHLLSDHVIERGPAFKRSMDMSLDVAKGEFTARYTEDDGKEKSISQRITLPPDIANGIVPILIKNIQPNAQQLTLPMVVATPKPRIIKLVISPDGETPFTTGAATQKATRYLVKIEIGGAAGLLAPLVGKQPPDEHIWVLRGDAPTFLKSEGPLYDGGPVWRIELVSPTWPQETTAGAPK